MTMRLIDANELRDLILNYDNNVLDNDQINAILDLIDDMPDATAIELPCRVGDTVYFVKAAFTFYAEPNPAKIRKIEICDDNTLFRACDRTFSIDDINKTVFLTHEAAAQALANQYKCKHLDTDGICMLHSDEDYAEHCLMGPCGDEEALQNATI